MSRIRESSQRHLLRSSLCLLVIGWIDPALTWGDEPAVPIRRTVQSEVAGLNSHNRARYETFKRTLEFGPPVGVSNLIASFNEKKKYRVGYTKLIQRIFADHLAKKPGVAQNLTADALDNALDSITKDEAEAVLKARFRNLTGLVVPKIEDLQKHVTRQNARANAKLRSAPQSLRIAPINEPTPDLVSFNWTEPGYAAPSTGIVTAVQDQSRPVNCGCCWAFATVGTFEAAYAKKNGVLIGASEQYLLNCTRGAIDLPDFPNQSWDCDGGWWAFDMLSSGSVQSPGLPTRLDLPYTGTPDACRADLDKPYKVANWGYVSDNANAIPSDDDLKKALCRYGPLAVAITAQSAWFGNQGDVLDDQPNDLSVPLNHAVTLVGWDNTLGAWIIKNSWGTGNGVHVNGESTGFLYSKFGYNNLGYSAAWVIAGDAPAR